MRSSSNASMGPRWGGRWPVAPGSRYATFAPSRTFTNGCTPFQFEGGSLIHFDLHPDNVLVSQQGPVVIDWTNARGGSAAADVAMTWLILETSAGLPGLLLARLFRRRVGRDVVRRGLADASAFRLADPNVTDAEKRRVDALVRNL
jgi:hypothetical protein